MFSYKLTKFHCKHWVTYFIKGGTITSSSKKNHVNGVLSTTRGLGNHGDLSLKKCVLVEPYATNVVVDQYAQFLVLGTTGIWDIFSDQEVANLLMRVSIIVNLQEMNFKKILFYITNLFQAMFLYFSHNEVHYVNAYTNVCMIMYIYTLPDMAFPTSWIEKQVQAC